MGLLGRALAGGVAAAADTTAQIMVDNNRARQASERDKANAVMQMNLEKLREERAAKTADVTHSRALSASYDPDTNRQLTNAEAAEFDTGSLIGENQAKQNSTINSTFTINGRPATNQQIADNADANENTSLIKSAAKERATDAISKVMNDPKLTDAEKREILASGEFTDDEQSAIDSWKGSAGKISNTKEDAAIAKAETQVALMQMKVDNATAIADLKLQSAKELLQAKIAAGNTAESSEYKQTLAEIKKAEEQRKSADSAAKLLEKTGGNMSPEETKLYNTFLRGAGTAEDVKDVPAVSLSEAKKQAHREGNEKAGLFSRDKTDFDGKSQSDWEADRVKEIMSGTPVVVEKPKKGLIKAVSKSPTLNMKDPRVIKAKAAGYSDKQIQDFMLKAKIK
jgi:hypothetical protein